MMNPPAWLYRVGRACACARWGGGEHGRGSVAHGRRLLWWHGRRWLMRSRKQRTGSMVGCEGKALHPDVSCPLSTDRGGEGAPGVGCCTQRAPTSPLLSQATPSASRGGRSPSTALGGGRRGTRLGGGTLLLLSCWKGTRRLVDATTMVVLFNGNFIIGSAIENGPVTDHAKELFSRTPVDLGTSNLFPLVNSSWS